MNISPRDWELVYSQTAEALQGTSSLDFEWTRESAVAALGAAILPSAVLQEGMGQDDRRTLRRRNARIRARTA